MAEVLFKDLTSKLDPDVKWDIDSAGCWARPNDPATSTAIGVMKDRDLNLNDHLSQPITDALLEKYALVLAMQEEHKRFILRNFPDAVGKTYLLYEMINRIQEIWDPVGMSKQAYANTADEMLRIMSEGFCKISELAV
jgi:protein-tyrosine-phosphatase